RNEPQCTISRKVRARSMSMGAPPTVQNSCIYPAFNSVCLPSSSAPPFAIFGRSVERGGIADGSRQRGVPAIGEYASPPCFMHELSPDFQPKPERTGAWGDVARWRKAERQRLIDARLAMSAQERAGRAERIAAG